MGPLIFIEEPQKYVMRVPRIMKQKKVGENQNTNGEFQKWKVDISINEIQQVKC